MFVFFHISYSVLYWILVFFHHIGQIIRLIKQLFSLAILHRPKTVLLLLVVGRSIVI